jgi:hypothetical protein
MMRSRAGTRASLGARRGGPAHRARAHVRGRSDTAARPRHGVIAEGLARQLRAA